MMLAIGVLHMTLVLLTAGELFDSSRSINYGAASGLVSVPILMILGSIVGKLSQIEPLQRRDLGMLSLNIFLCLFAILYQWNELGVLIPYELYLTGLVLICGTLGLSYRGIKRIKSLKSGCGAT